MKITPASGPVHFLAHAKQRRVALRREGVGALPGEDAERHPAPEDHQPRRLSDRPRRFTELRELLRAVTPKVLSETLRTMQRDGLITRRDLEANPPHVEYSLTPLGLSLLELIDAARSWSEAHLNELVAARRSRIG